MRKRTILAVAILAQTAVAQLVEPAPSPPLGTKPRLLGSYESLKIGDRERLLVIAPHPDDETLGAAGLIQRVIEGGGTVRIVLMTAGDAYVEVVRHETRKPKPTSPDFVAFGKRRIKESLTAMRKLDDGDRIRVQLLGFPDGGLDALLCSYWSSSKPYRSPTSGASDPPYDREALNPDIPYAGEGLRRELAGVIEDARPTLVALPDPLDNHPDHHAAGVFALIALNDWLSHPGPASLEPDRITPRILAYLVHWPHWPPDAKDAAQPFCLPGDYPAHGVRPVSLEMSDREQKNKRAALACYASQQTVMSGMVAFLRDSEPFTQFGVQDLRDAASYLTTASVSGGSVLRNQNPK